jgi:hypothetical protein
VFGNIQYHSGTQIFASILWDSVARSDSWSWSERYMNDQSLGWSWWEESGVEKGIFLEEEKAKENLKYFFFGGGISFYLSIVKFLLEKEFFWWLEPNIDLVIILNKSQKSEVKSLCILTTYTLNCMQTIFQKLF